MFGLLPGLSFIGVLYFAACFVLYRIGRKLGPAPMSDYFIPVVNLVRLAQYAGVSPWIAVAVVLPAILPFLTGTPEVLGLAGLFAVFANGYFWGCIARALGKDFWMGAMSLLLLGIPVLMLAFDDTARATIPVQDSTQAPGWQGSISLVCCSGELAGQSLVLPASGIVIGRHPQAAHLILQSPDVSSAHARLVPAPENQGVWLEDLESTNGTTVARSNSPWRRLDRRELLMPGDRFCVGSAAEFVLRLL